MTKKSKLLINNSIDPVTSRLREAIYSNELNKDLTTTTSTSTSNNTTISDNINKTNSNQTSQILKTKIESENASEIENRRKKRRKSTPNFSLSTKTYIESDNDDEYLALYVENETNNENDLTIPLTTSNSNNNLINNEISVQNNGGLNYYNNDNKIINNDDDEDDDDDDDEDEDEEDFDEQRKWNLEEKLNVFNKYNSKFVKFLDAKEFNFKYIQENGFNEPFVFEDKSGLGMRVPSENFRVSDVKSCVGSKRIVDVVDVNTQKGLTMTMKDWCEYYENTNRDRLLNVISLEFSHTKLENYVEAPLVVRQLDWIETAWPKHLRDAHTESTNIIEKMKYPKVQKYVLMSVAGCYTDFHIDMGGTSVWYHVLKGEKIFWLMPPTDKNLKTYEKWVLSGNQSKVFLPDLMDECERIVLKQGWTFLLPSGWIHGVYTSKDSLVFGGNFLHSFNVPMQLKIFNLETKTKVPQQYRYPFFVEMIWFVLERYVHCLTGVTHMDDFNETTNLNGFDDRKAYKTFQPNQSIMLNKFEYEGLNTLYQYLMHLNESKRHIPKEIVQSDLLIQSLKNILDVYAKKFELNESMNQPNGMPFMHWPKPEKKYMKKIEINLKKKEQDLKQQFQRQQIENILFNNNEQNSIENQFNQQEDKANNSNGSSQEQNDYFQHSILSISTNSAFSDLSPNQTQTQTRKHVMRNLPRTKGSIKKRLRPQNVPRSNVERRRRVRCHNCEPCTRDDCGDCKYCKDMKKFGGTGISKQCCLAKQCLQPLLPTTTTCMLCEAQIDRFNQDKTNIMYECEICFEIYHVQCFRKQYCHLNDIEPLINEDLSNCWKCPNCVNKGYIKGDSLKQEVKPNQLDLSSGSNSLNNSFNSMIPNVTSNSTSNNGAIDFFLSPSSTSTTNITFPIKSKHKRHRRTKQEIENSKLKIDINNDYYLNGDSLQANASDNSHNNNTNSPNSLNGLIVNNENLNIKRKRKTKLKLKIEPNKQNQDDDSIISIDSLTNYEKQILLNEFCEICYDDEPQKRNNFQKCNSDINNNNFKTSNKNHLNSNDHSHQNSKINSFNSANLDNETIIVDEDDDNTDYDLGEEKSHLNNNDTTSFRSISVNNNDSTSTQNSFSETTHTDEYNLEYDNTDSNNENIYYDDNEDDMRSINQKNVVQS